MRLHRSRRVRPVSLRVRWPAASLSHAQRWGLLGAARSRLAAKTGLRNGLARCHDGRFARSGGNFLRHKKRATLWLVRRGKNLEQNPRWTALNCLCAERIYRGWVGVFRPDRARYSASVFVSKKRSPAKPLAAKKKIIVPVTFHIPGPLREFTGGRSRVTVEPSPVTLAEALAALWRLHPGLRDRLATEQGQMREHVSIFVGDEDVRYTGGLTSPVPPGSDIFIVPAISGGCGSALTIF